MESVIPKAPDETFKITSEFIVSAKGSEYIRLGLENERAQARKSIVDDFMWNLEHPGQTREFVKMCDGIREIMKGDFKPRARNFVFVGTELREI